MGALSVREALQQVGFEFIQIEPRLPKITTSFRPDVLAWAANTEGSLVPWAIVEVKRDQPKPPSEVTLSALAKSRDLLGTVDHYVVVNGSWYRADAGLRAC